MPVCITNDKKETCMNSCSIKKEKPRIKNLFFEMSRPVESPEMLKGWVDWFRGLHIPCAIARTEAGYTLWRRGKEVGRRRSKVSSVCTDFVYSFGLSPRELKLLKELPQEGDDEGCAPSEEFEDMSLSRWEEPQEGLVVNAAAVSTSRQSQKPEKNRERQ
jgi:hypothetical protein